MAYDEALAGRIRDLLAGEAGITEKRMFGGRAFLVQGNMAVTASGRGGMMARVDPADTDTLVDGSRVVPMEMRGRPMRGWLHVDPAAIAGEADLRAWVTRSVAFARALPAKP